MNEINIIGGPYNMSKQNIYDNRIFFEGYKKLRENPLSTNTIIENMDC